MLLEVDNLHSFYGSSHVLQGVNLEVQTGRIVSLLGRNGMGKTTLIRSIMHMTPPNVHDGTVRFQGEYTGITLSRDRFEDGSDRRLIRDVSGELQGIFHTQNGYYLKAPGDRDEVGWRQNVITADNDNSREQLDESVVTNRRWVRWMQTLIHRTGEHLPFF
jgi:ABC-type branched-subunit amino acid transport system ATPase component